MALRQRGPYMVILINDTNTASVSMDPWFYLQTEIESYYMPPPPPQNVIKCYKINRRLETGISNIPFY